MARVLIVDDDENICSAFELFLGELGHTALITSNANDALALVEEDCPDLVVMDIRMPGTDGLEALPAIRRIAPEVPVVMMTAYGTSQTSIEAVQRGAYDYLTKPLDLDTIKPLIERALEARAVHGQPRLEPADEYSLVNLVGKSPLMQEAYRRIGLLASNDVPLLIVGEPGVGKHQVARTIHFNSARKERPFAVVSCRGMPEAALERELFGQEDPASGAVLAQGKLETARGGTALIDDVDALPAALQARLLRAVVDGRFERAGGATPLTLDARIIVSTECDLQAQVESGNFSPVLAQALSVVAIELPALRDRPGDIPELVSLFIHRCNDELGKSIRGVDARVEQTLLEHPWPGNVGQLRQAITRACVLARGEVLTTDDLGNVAAERSLPGAADGDVALEAALRAQLDEALNERAGGAARSPFHDIIERVEQILVREAVARMSGNQVKAAELLDLNRTTLRKKMRPSCG